MSTPSPSGKRVATGLERTIVIALDRAIYALSRHWLAFFNLVALIYVGLPMLAPVLMHAGFTGPGRLIYTVYSPMCHQMASRSFFLFGEQPVYPRELAGTSFTPIERYEPSIPEFSNVSPTNWLQFTLAARQFLGNAQMGYKMALCERDISIYSFVFFGGLLYGFLRSRIRVRSLPFWAFALIGLGPIGLDGFSQLFGYYGAPLDGGVPTGVAAFFHAIFPLRESTPFLRVLTGALFGLMLVWLVYPSVGEGMKETEEQLEQKLTRIGVLPSKEGETVNS